MPSRLGSRFLIEALVIVAVAVVVSGLDHTGAVDLSRLQKIVAIFGTWELIVLVHLATTRQRPEAAAPAAQLLAPAEPVAVVAAAVPLPIVAVQEPEPESAAEPEQALAESVAEPVPEPERELVPELESVPEPMLDVAIYDEDDEREWNLWELERLASERQGEDPARDEEWAFLPMYLRDFANPDGALPVDFHTLVRDSFSDLIASARP